MGGDMGGGMGGGGGGPGGAMGGMAGTMPGKVLKKGKGGGQGNADEEQMAPTMIKLTSIEQKMAEMLEDVASTVGMQPHRIRAQFPIPNPKGGKPYSIDFAIPHIKLGVESDGEYWHERPEQKQDDQERDYLLAQRGWTILRFDDKTIEESPQAVKATINSYITEAAAPKEKAAETENRVVVGDSGETSIHLFTMKNGQVIDLGTDYDIYYPEMYRVRVTS